MKRSVKVYVIMAVCKCIDVSELSAKVIAARRSVKVLMIKAVRRWPDVSKKRVLDAVRGEVPERRTVKAHVADAMRW